MIRSAPLFDLTLRLGELFPVGQVAAGERRVAAVAGGTLVGSAGQGGTGTLLNGELVSGTDTQMLRHDGVLEIDAAYVVRLAQGGHLRIVNQGYRHGPAEVLQRLALGEAVPASEYFFRTVMRFETGVPELAWLNRAIAVAEAERQGGSVLLHAWQVL